MLPGSEALAELIAIVRLYTNDEWDWDLRLSLAAEAIERTRLKLGARLGWTTRIGTTPRVGEDLIVDPRAFRTRRVQG
jgi:type VI secretion system protein ImpH